ALRAIPNLMVIRPADANETAVAWKVALNRKEGPTALLLTRQALPMVTADGKGLVQGAYILKEAANGKPDAVLVASGSEVSLAVAAREKLLEEGIQCRVVSMPSFELFDEQPVEYQEKVIPKDVPSASIEAGVSLGWDKYLSKKHDVIGLDRFGASAPYKVLFEQFGFTVTNIVAHVKSLL
ncbi:MAG: transketolase-like TK C-terminal-containing protein, partial [Candidatus Kryptoniota bacterium]